MLKFLKNIFSAKTITTIYGLCLVSTIFISGYHLFNSTDLFNLGKYLLIIILAIFMLTGVEHMNIIIKENKEK